MSRIYIYEESKYKFKVVFIGYFMIVLSILFPIVFLLDTSKHIYAFGALLAIYGSLNTFLFKSNPGKIVIDDDSISFVSYGQAKYKISDLNKFVIKEFANAQFYIRAEDKHGLKGRYWVSYYYFSDKEEMIDELYFIEKKIHPDNLKFQGRENMFNIRPCYEIADDVLKKVEG